MSNIKYPATQIVHTPSGPTNACDAHAVKALNLFRFLGCHVVSTELPEPAECDNCTNDNKDKP